MQILLDGVGTEWDRLEMQNSCVTSDWEFKFFLELVNGRLYRVNMLETLSPLDFFTKVAGNLI